MGVCVWNWELFFKRTVVEERWEDDGKSKSSRSLKNPEQVRSNSLKVAEERSESRVPIVDIRITRR